MHELTSKVKLKALRMNFNDPPITPIDSANRWFDHAGNTIDTQNPLACALTTVTKHGQPSSRMVLLKGFDDQGAVFYTNYNSDKAMDIEQNPLVSMLFHWDLLHRQLRIQGVATRVSEEESNAYFATRPRLSQIGAWASDQSQRINSRDELLEKVVAVTEQWEGKEIPRPEFWGGYRVTFTLIEFWEAQEGRLHDRLRYTRKDDWTWNRLQP